MDIETSSKSKTSDIQPSSKPRAKLKNSNLSTLDIEVDLKRPQSVVQTQEEAKEPKAKIVADSAVCPPDVTAGKYGKFVTTGEVGILVTTDPTGTAG